MSRERARSGLPRCEAVRESAVVRAPGMTSEERGAHR